MSDKVEKVGAAGSAKNSAAANGASMGAKNTGPGDAFSYMQRPGFFPVSVGNFDDTLYVINSGGTFRWSYTTGNDIESSPVIGPVRPF
jgi:hypothetical protein